MTEIEISSIRPNPRQPRRSFDRSGLEELAQSIQEYGVLQPLLVRKTVDGSELISGERRLRASKIAGLKKVPAITIDPDHSLGSLTIALVENVQRSDLSIIELAKAYKQLQDEFGRTQEEIARAVGKSRPQVANTLRLLDLSTPIQDALEEGSITAGHARAILMAPAETRNILFDRVVKDGISVRQTENAARAASKSNGGIKSEDAEKKVKISDEAAVERMVREMEKSIESALGRRCILNRGRDGKGKLIVEFYSDRDLEGLVQKLRGK